MRRKKGLFITVEGTEGTGKSTQIQLLTRYLKRSGHDVLKTQEPGGTPFGRRIRKALLYGKDSFTRETETILYMASRAELVQKVIQPALRRGKIVLCDRWADATIAYQGYGLGVNVNWIQGLAKKATGGLEPNLTLFLDLPVATGLRRVKARGRLDRIEKRSIQFHRRVRKGYLALVKKHRRMVRIRVTTIPKTHETIKKIVDGIV